MPIFISKQTIMKYILITLLALFTLLPFSGCDTKQRDYSTQTTNISVFYFNRYTEKNISRIENGKITIYGNVINVDRTVEKETYFILDRHYNGDDEIYTFKTGGGIIVFDVPNKTFSVNSITYYINSTIKSDW